MPKLNQMKTGTICGAAEMQSAENREEELMVLGLSIDATEAPSAAKPAPKPAFAASGSLPAPHTIANMFANQKWARAPSPDDGIEENFPLLTDLPELPTEEESSSDELGDEEEEEEEEPVLEQVEEQNMGTRLGGHTVLDDAALRDPKELSALAAASLKMTRKQKDYRSEVLFASLVNFYCWMPRMGQLLIAFN
ncbi:hypothetical protein B0H11DRAFT_1905200 [Mycena galericulata]|nr:hypothetical protein B0H11DRAFT_1905200 [Mycena galericulata]